MLEIGNNIRIRKLDEANIIIECLKQVKSKNTGELREVWDLVGYYSNLKDAIQGVLNQKLVEKIEDKVMLSQCIEKINSVSNELKECIKDIKIKQNKEN